MHSDNDNSGATKLGSAPAAPRRVCLSARGVAGSSASDAAPHDHVDHAALDSPNDSDRGEHEADEDEDEGADMDVGIDRPAPRPAHQWHGSSRARPRARRGTKHAYTPLDGRLVARMKRGAAVDASRGWRIWVLGEFSAGCPSA